MRGRETERARKERQTGKERHRDIKRKGETVQRPRGSVTERSGCTGSGDRETGKDRPTDSLSNDDRL